ncbi:hypothetical protein ABS315_20595 [Peribacillus frigoritolerans]|uniref:hypothetical protein n=1 Tax=Peribacillus frigoritolerans TaxID=450367 RepID=UPI0034E0B880
MKRIHKLEVAMVGLEPTGHYWVNLSKWLIKHEIEVVTIKLYVSKIWSTFNDYGKWIR